MPNFFRIRHKTDPAKLYVRDLRPGMTVPVGSGKSATVHSIEVMDGHNGEPPKMMLGGGLPSAMAMKVYFNDHEPLIAHPGTVVR